VTGDFYVDTNANGIYDIGDSELVMGQSYPIWFSANFNNWRCMDAYGNDAWGPFTLEGTIMAAVVPEPCTLSLLGLGLVGLVGTSYRRRRRA
jgi:hypothetical protein